jgi:hypothetical protein
MARDRSSLLYLLFFLTVFLPAASLSQAPPPGNRFKISPTLSVSEPGTWKTIHKGAEYRTVTFERSEPQQTIDLKIVRFDGRWIAPRIVPSQLYGLKGASVKTLGEKSGAVAMINANYFDGNGKPLGFLKVAAADINPNISRSDLYTGIFAIKDHTPFIVHRDQFLPPQADEGLQAGPLLLTRSLPLTVTRGAERQFRRSVIGIDPEQRLVIAVTDTLFGGLTWAELQEFFGSPRWQAQTSDLLNLDGGGSSQLYIRGAQFQEYVAGTADVPTAIGFFPRAN